MPSRRRQGGRSKGMSHRHRHKASHKKSHTKHKHGHKKSHSAAHKAGGKAGGAKPGRRMDHHFMRRRFLHAGALGAGMFGFEDEMDENPFIDDDLFDDSLMEMEEEGSDESEDDVSEMGEDNTVVEGPAPLESDDHYHVFIYHSSSPADQEQIEHYVRIIENSPYDLKVLTSEKDFKSELNPTQNLMLAIGLSQKTVLHCSFDFMENELPNYEAAVQHVLSEEERRQNVILLVDPDIELPISLQKYKQTLRLTDPDCFERLTKLLSSSSGRHHANSSNDRSNPTPSAPSPSMLAHVKDDNHESEAKEPTTIYSNGLMIKKVTACNYESLESQDVEKGLCTTFCPDILCTSSESVYNVPDSLTKRGLQVTESEFQEILKSLTESANITFFQKSVDCSLPCLYLSTMVIVAVINCCMWFLVAGALHHYKKEGESISSPLFWSFMSLVFFIPGAVALIMVVVTLHFANYKYLKYRIKIEEFNKRFRETNLVLHVRKGFWSCSGKLKLFFIYYNFEECQQTLYCHVHDSMKTSHTSGENEKLLNDNIATVKLDKIMKRVNTLTKKFEWDYFEALTTQNLPNVAQKEHRKKGMCFCQYVLHREQSGGYQTSVVQNVKDQVVSMKKNAFKKSHQRRSTREHILPRYIAPVSTNNGKSKFGDRKSNSVTFM